MSLAVFLDIVIAVLLTVAIAAAWVLNRRLAAFREAKAEFEQFIERFNTAAARAEAGVNALKLSSDATGRALQQTVVRAQALRDEMTFLIERAEPMIDRLAATHRAATEAPAAEPARAPAAAPVRPRPAAKPAADAETDLLKTLSSLR